jgi:hypothetical protein
MQSSRQNFENDMSIHVSCYRPRGPYRHSLLHICIQIMEQQLYSILHIWPLHTLAECLNP